MPELLVQPNFDGRSFHDLCEVIFYQMEESRFQLHTRRTKDELSHIFLSPNGDFQDWYSLEQMFDFVRWRGYLGDVIIRSWVKNDPAVTDFISKYKNVKGSDGGAKAEAEKHKPEKYPRQRAG
jgi:hypothetical protein